MKFLKNIFILIAMIFSIVVIIAIVILNKNKFKGYFTYTNYKDFGINVPEGYSIYGIDVSHYQEEIDWNKVAKMNVNGKRVNFVFIKATQGINLIDPNFERNWTYSNSKNIKRGVYHFFDAEIDGNSQADFFLKNTKLMKGDLRPVVDIEGLQNVDYILMKKRLKEWLIKVEETTHQVPIIYTNANFYKMYLSEDFSEYPLWVSHYTDDDFPKTKRNWHFWQYSERGRVNGINGYVDFDVFNGDSSSFENFLIK